MDAAGCKFILSHISAGGPRRRAEFCEQVHTYSSEGRCWRISGQILSPPMALPPMAFLHSIFALNLATGQYFIRRVADKAQLMWQRGLSAVYRTLALQSVVCVAALTGF